MLTTAKHTATFDFAGSVVLVTGGGTGIGLAVTRAFLESGATVVVAGRRAEPLDQAIAEAGMDRGLAVPCDVGDRRAVQDLVQTIVARFGRLDVVVSNAAIFVSSPLARPRPGHLGADETGQRRRLLLPGAGRAFLFSSRQEGA